jgi:uncharacterized membrane protein YgaE (UPF0421/DUF939 family)
MKGITLMKIEFKKLGMRNIKTAIAVVISILISRGLNMEYPFYAAIASIISMQSSVENSFKAGRNRMLGTIVGAFVGYLCALISPGNPFLTGIGIVCVIYFCNLFNWKESSSIAGVVFCVIMLNLKGNSPILYSINRIIDTFVGIIVAIMVNYFIMPPKEKEKNGE